MTKGASRPSYIPRERFVSALLGRGGETRAKVFAALGSGGDASATTQKVLEGLPAGELKRGLTATWVKAKRDVSTFRPLAEEWYAGAPAAAAKVRALIADLPDGPIKKAMQTLWIEAGSDADAFRKEAEGWFDEAMQRLSGCIQAPYAGLALGRRVRVRVAARRRHDPDRQRALAGSDPSPAARRSGAARTVVGDGCGG